MEALCSIITMATIRVAGLLQSRGGGLQIVAPNTFHDYLHLYTEMQLNYSIQLRPLLQGHKILGEQETHNHRSGIIKSLAARRCLFLLGVVLAQKLGSSSIVPKYPFVVLSFLVPPIPQG